MSLTSIGNRCGTDKGNHLHSFNGVSYLEVYEENFKHLKNEKIKILEIGVLGGSSLRMWKEYFPQAQIYGLDITPSAKSHEEDRIRIDIGSQNDIEFLKNTYKDISFDIIIDDGSHFNEFTINAFNYLFYNHLKSGAIYTIEDIGCTYSNLFLPNMIWTHNDRSIFNKFILDILKDMDHMKGSVRQLSFYSLMAFFKKL